MTVVRVMVVLADCIEPIPVVDTPPPSSGTVVTLEEQYVGLDVGPVVRAGEEVLDVSVMIPNAAPARHSVPPVGLPYLDESLRKIYPGSNEEYFPESLARFPSPRHFPLSSGIGSSYDDVPVMGGVFDSPASSRPSFYGLNCSSAEWDEAIMTQVGLPVPVWEREGRTLETSTIGVGTDFSRTCSSKCGPDTVQTFRDSGQGGGRVNGYPSPLELAACRIMEREQHVFINPSASMCHWRRGCRHLEYPGKTKRIPFCRTCMHMIVHDTKTDN